MRRWKILAKEIHGHTTTKSPVEVGPNDSPGESNEDLTKNSEGNLEDVGSDVKGESSLQGSEIGSAEADDGKTLKFNEDLTCEHGK